jgi:N-acetyl-anhydromuramyl-L-alanine amidase AmpD
MDGFIQAKNYQAANRTELRLIVVHTMENPEKPGTAHAVASWFAGPDAPIASAHLCIDNAEVWGCVHVKDIAFGAPHANRDGFHIEHAGRASQGAVGWADPYSEAMLGISAQEAAKMAAAYSIPVVHLTPAEIAQGLKGFCGHADVTKAYATIGGHEDPGPDFPWDHYLEMVRDALASIQDTEPPPAA